MKMPQQTIDYEAVVADLEAKRAAFNSAVDGAIAGIKHVLGAIAAMPGSPQVIATATVPSGAVVHPASVTPDTFFGLNLAESAIRYLQIVKKQQTTREITDALEAANFHHQSSNFVNTVNTALYRRERDEADVVRIGRNWALAEWYPGRRRPVKPSRPDPAGLVVASVPAEPPLDIEDEPEPPMPDDK